MRLLWLLLSTPALVLSAPADVGRELIANGGFEASRDGRFPDGYSGDRQVVRSLEEGGNHFVRLGDPDRVTSASVGQNPKLAPDWFKLRLRIRVRARDIVLGAEGWHNARVAMSFHDADGKQVGGWPNVLNWAGSTDGWQSVEREFAIPAGAVELRITPALFQAKGTVDYDDFSVVVTKLRPTVTDGTLPPGVTADWSLDGATREEWPRRGRVCLNGLWRFQPGGGATRPAEGSGWGWLKVPAAWPGKNVDCVEPLGPDCWDLAVDWTKVEQGWYERDVTVPAEWADRRVFVEFDLPQTEAEVWVGGRALGSVRFPSGRVDLTDALRPGTTTRLTVRVTTAPLAKERMVAMREDLLEQVKADVKFRGLVGDVWLTSEPAGARLTSLQVRPSVRQRSLGLAVGLSGLGGGRYHLAATVGAAWSGQSASFAAVDQFAASLPWANPKLWDFEQPNLYDLRVSLVDEATGQTVDTRATRFGFRELWLDGQEIILNGTPVRWRALDFNGVTRSDDKATGPAVRRWLSRARGLGFNFIILSNYDLAPGETTSFGELLDTCDELGFALSFSLPQALGGVGRTGQQPDDEWRRVASYCVATAGNHPSVLAYAGDHNRLGYHGDQNPEKLDGRHPPVPPASMPWVTRSRDVAAVEEAYVRALDPTRELYHHQSGTFGAWHTVNCYLNWSPIQERSEWLSAWSRSAVKPLFFVEWGPPHEASWGGHRQGPFIWRNKVNSEPLGIEYGAMLFGDAAYRPHKAMERYVDQYEKVYARRQPFHISEVLGTCWDVRNELNNIDIKTAYTDVVWPRLRTAGISAILPWDQDHVGYPSGPGPASLDLSTDWSKLQRPGHAPDFERPASDYWSAPTDKLTLTSWGRSFQRWNQPVIAYLGGAPDRFAERGHNVSAGETLVKQVVLVNDSRARIEAAYTWSATTGEQPFAFGRGTLVADPGHRQFQPLRFAVPAGQQGELTLAVTVHLPGGDQRDCLTLHVVAPREPVAASPFPPAKLALFDPRGLSRTDWPQAQLVDAGTSLDGYAALVLGREAITTDNALPNVAGLLARGGKVLVMEQTEDALTHRLGFRCNDPSLRNVFVRCASHPVLAGLDNARLADWRGEATLIPPRMALPADWAPGDPPKDWLGFANTRVWKWGNTGQVASVVIEKPQRGDWTALVDGGFDLQYAPLLLGRVGRGEVLFCQLDVTARSAADPAAQRLWANLVDWVGTPSAPAPRSAAYLGGDDGAKLLADLGAQVTRVDAGQLPTTGTLVVGPHAGPRLVAAKAALDAAVRGGLTVVVLPHEPTELGWLPVAVPAVKEARTVSTVPAGKWFTGLGPSELHWRGRRTVTCVGAQPNVLAAVPHGTGAFVFCQILPTDFDYADEYRVYLKPTAKRTATLLSRLLANCGVPFETPLTDCWNNPTPPLVSLAGTWQIVQDPGDKLTADTLTDALPWRTLQAPGTFESQLAEWKDYDGVVWYRRHFAWTGDTTGPVALRLGAVDDEDWTYLNGQPVGHIGQDTHPKDYWSHPRVYPLPPGLLKPGDNTVVVKVRDLRQSGGFTTGPLDVRRPERWLASYYLDTPAQLDDPYRYNRW